jgi:hypothetical protein
VNEADISIIFPSFFIYWFSGLKGPHSIVSVNKQLAKNTFFTSVLLLEECHTTQTNKERHL